MSKSAEKEKKRGSMTDEQQNEVRAGLHGRSEEYDIVPVSGPHSGNPSSRWTVVELGRRSVTLRQPRKGHILLDTGKRGPGAPPRTGTSDVNEAIRFAEEWLASDRDDALVEAGIEAAVDRSREEP
jgi:hypothetical protein